MCKTFHFVCMLVVFFAEIAHCYGCCRRANEDGERAGGEDAGNGRGGGTDRRHQTDRVRYVDTLDCKVHVAALSEKEKLKRFSISALCFVGWRRCSNWCAPNCKFLLTNLLSFKVQLLCIKAARVFSYFRLSMAIKINSNAQFLFSLSV